MISTEKENLKIMLYNHKTWEFISKNKPLTDRNITWSIDLFLGYLKDGITWYSISEYDQVPGALSIPWNNVEVTVCMDSTVIYSGNPTQSLTVLHHLQDSDQNTVHRFEIKLQGLTNDHNPPWPRTGEHGGLALQIRGHVENIPLCLLMPKFAKYTVEDGSVNVATEILGQNGCQTLVFNTPFYSWLHQHRESLIWELTYPSGYVS